MHQYMYQLSKTTAFIFAQFILFAFFTATAVADIESTKQFTQHTAHYSVFNSSFITPEIAKVYNIVRSKDQALINIALTDNQQPTAGGVKADVTGSVSNLMSQKIPLNFIEVREQNTLYYLAAFHISNAETLNFDIEIKSNSAQPAYQVKFSRTLYHDEEHDEKQVQ